MQMDDIIEQIQRIHHIQAIKELLKTLCQHLGFQHYWYMSSRSLKNYRTHTPDIVLTDYPEEFEQGFIHRQRIGQCPVIFYAQRHSGLPALWQELFNHHQLPDNQQEQLAWAAHFEIQNGVACPVTLTPSHRDLLHFSLKDTTHHSTDALHCLKCRLASIACLLSHKMNTLITPSLTSCTPLRPREKEVLLWAARGKTAWETGKILGISQTTVQEYLQGSMYKLQVVNKTQAIAQCLAQGCLTLDDML